MSTYTIFAIPILTYILVSNIYPDCRQTGYQQPQVLSSWVNSSGGYENFIFASPDKNITDYEAKTHRLDPGRHHHKITEMKHDRGKRAHQIY